MEKTAIFCPVSRETIHSIARKKRKRIAVITRIDFVCSIIFLGVWGQVFRMIRYVWLNVLHECPMTTVQRNKKRGLYSFTEGTTKHLYEHKHNPRSRIREHLLCLLPVRVVRIGRFTVNAIALNAIKTCGYIHPDDTATKVEKLSDFVRMFWAFIDLRMQKVSPTFAHNDLN